jgi:NAD(P)-dependent dehydrogenase (short-subunit alcohol dehydrogenase family)
MAVVLITGGSSGIGLAIVQRLAAAGDRVFTASRNPTRNDLPDGVTPIVLDVADPQSARAAITRVVEDAGRIDVLVNNAGTMALGALEEITDEEAHRVLEVNLFGPLRLVRAVLPIMRAQGDGHIVNVSSVNDVVWPVFGGWYSASKAALTSITATLDSEVHDFGIRVTTVAPGYFESEMSAGLVEQPIPEDSPYRAALEGLRAYNATRVAADPAAVAEAVDRCIRDPDPPVRLVVGTDGLAMDQWVRETPPTEVTALMRQLAARLAPSDNG